LTDTVYVVLAAALLSGAAVSLLAWRVAEVEPSQPERLIGELRVARWAAVLLAAIGGISVGLAIGARSVAGTSADVAFGAVFIGVAGVVLQREPREGLLVAAGAFVVHALLDIAHRPGWLPPEVAPHWYTAGCAVYDVYIAGLCYWARRR